MISSRVGQSRRKRNYIMHVWRTELLQTSPLIRSLFLSAKLCHGHTYTRTQFYIFLPSFSFWCPPPPPHFPSLSLTGNFSLPLFFINVQPPFFPPLPLFISLSLFLTGSLSGGGCVSVALYRSGKDILSV